MYNPLCSEDCKAHLEAKTEELGSYPYVLNLKANPPVPEAAVHFKTFLGQVASQTVTLVNPVNSRIEFNARVRSFYVIFHSCIISC